MGAKRCISSTVFLGSRRLDGTYNRLVRMRHKSLHIKLIRGLRNPSPRYPSYLHPYMGRQEKLTVTAASFPSY